MANSRFFGHTGSGGTLGGTRIADEGYSWSTWGENFAAWSAPETPQAVMNRWMNSPGHRANILKRDFCDLVVGRLGDANSSGAIWDTYWTQNFARKQGVNQCPAGGPDHPDDTPDELDTPDDSDNTPDDNPATIGTRKSSPTASSAAEGTPLSAVWTCLAPIGGRRPSPLTRTAGSSLFIRPLRRTRPKT